MTHLLLAKLTHRILVVAACLPLVACAGEVESADDDATNEDQSNLAAADCIIDQIRTCTQSEDASRPGYQFCYAADAGNTWSDCAPDYRPSGPDECAGDAEWNGSCCVDWTGCCAGEPCNTPLVLAFDDQPVRYSTFVTGAFDLTGRGASIVTDWPTAATPWLAIDRDGDGAITDGGELFGSATRLASGALADNGFTALAELDSDRDGFITAADGAWSKLVVWRDVDASRSSQPSELSSVTRAGLEAIELDYGLARRCDARGNCEVERARFWARDGHGALHVGTVVDVHLELQ